MKNLTTIKGKTNTIHEYLKQFIPGKILKLCLVSI